MADVTMLDRAYYATIQGFINTGQAPHYTELAVESGLSVERHRARGRPDFISWMRAQQT